MSSNVEHYIECPLCLDEWRADMREEVSEIRLWVWICPGSSGNKYGAMPCPPEPPSLDYWEVKGIEPDCGHDKARGFYDLVDEKIHEDWDMNRIEPDGWVYVNERDL